MRTLLVSALLLTNCATMSNGTTQRVSVTSIPEGAAITLQECGPVWNVPAVAPATVTVSRRATRCQIHLSMPGHETAVVHLRRQLARDENGRLSIIGAWCEGCDAMTFGVMSWLYLPLAIPGFTIDLLSGAMYELSPETVKAHLRASPSASPPTAGSPAGATPSRAHAGRGGECCPCHRLCAGSRLPPGRPAPQQR